MLLLLFFYEANANRMIPNIVIILFFYSYGLSLYYHIVYNLKLFP